MRRRDYPYLAYSFLFGFLAAWGMIMAIDSCVVAHVEPVRVERVQAGSANAAPAGNGTTLGSSSIGEGATVVPLDPCATLSIGSTGSASYGWQCQNTAPSPLVHAGALDGR